MPLYFSVVQLARSKFAGNHLVTPQGVCDDASKIILPHESISLQSYAPIRLHLCLMVHATNWQVLLDGSVHV